jgi:hypothetical protein
MSIKIGVGLGEEGGDWDLLEQCRKAWRSGAQELELDADDAAGWPLPSERGDDEPLPALPAWSW